MKTIRRQGSTGFSRCWHRGGGYEAIMAAAALAMVSGAPFQERTDSGGQYWIKQSLDLDHSLVERCLSGDEAAWEGLVRTHTRRVYGLCYRFTGKDGEAQDLTQEVFLRVYRTLKTFRATEGAFTTWLARLTRNLLIDNYRRTRQDRGIGLGGFQARKHGGRPRGQRDFAGGLAEALAGVARGGHLARLAGFGVPGDRRDPAYPGGNREVPAEPGPGRIGPCFAKAEGTGMTCAELEILICDYVDGTLGPDARTTPEQHLAGCRNCAELARDAAAAVGFMERAAEVEPPPELMTRLLFHAPWVNAKTATTGLKHWFRKALHPILQPRFAMGMAMTILSFAMLARFVTPARQLRAADLAPAQVWSSLEDRVYRGWQRTVKFYESLKVVYQIQSKLHDWQQQQEEEPKPAADTEKSGRSPDTHRLPVKGTDDRPGDLSHCVAEPRP